jgi:hypothetical protein
MREDIELAMHLAMPYKLYCSSFQPNASLPLLHSPGVTEEAVDSLPMYALLPPAPIAAAAAMPVMMAQACPSDFYKCRYCNKRMSMKDEEADRFSCKYAIQGTSKCTTPVCKDSISCCQKHDMDCHLGPAWQCGMCHKTHATRSHVTACRVPSTVDQPNTCKHRLCLAHDCRVRHIQTYHRMPVPGDRVLFHPPQRANMHGLQLGTVVGMKHKASAYVDVHFDVPQPRHGPQLCLIDRLLCLIPGASASAPAAAAAAAASIVAPAVAPAAAAPVMQVAQIGQCVVCLDAKAVAITTACAHVSMCMACAHQWKIAKADGSEASCPECRASWKDVHLIDGSRLRYQQCDAAP